MENRRPLVRTRAYVFFRSRLSAAAHMNMAQYNAWLGIFSTPLKKQFLASGSGDIESWHRSRFECDVGLVLANGIYTRIGAHEILDD